MSHAQPSQKSPYVRSNSAARGRGVALIVAVVVLLAAAGAWITTYTRAVETTPIGSTQQPLDPGAAAQSGSTSSATK